jgi:hypothetical protein
MSPLMSAINLQFGKNALPYQDVILLTLINWRVFCRRQVCAICVNLTAKQNRYPLLRKYAPVQIIPNKRGSQSEISGM